MQSPYVPSKRRTRYRVMTHGSTEVEQMGVHRKEADAYVQASLLVLRGMTAWVEIFEQERTTP